MEWWEDPAMMCLGDDRLVSLKEVSEDVLALLTLMKDQSPELAALIEKAGKEAVEELTGSLFVSLFSALSSVGMSVDQKTAYAEEVANSWKGYRLFVVANEDKLEKKETPKA